ncbi:Vacuolar protein sorting-associated protein 25 [Vitis vinifera]|uniref:Vacuolar protein sorting-associated protein 25 n=1 Tax=Vitis vinifera TaxID=29760 RepID=A0A438FZJ6_VITVI|nr:Vacuolar protein sorting-associated protein 25 [Vitis vinifera]
MHNHHRSNKFVAELLHINSELCSTFSMNTLNFGSDGIGTLSHEAREAFLSALVLEGRAEWMDKGHKKCLILWHQIQDWADIILHFVSERLWSEDSVMTGNAVRN